MAWARPRKACTSLRFGQAQSSSLTITDVSRLSQIRGGAKKYVGPISLRSDSTVAALPQLGQAQQERLRVALDAARVDVDHVLQPGTLSFDVQELVDLLLVLDDREARLGVIDDEGQLALDRVLVERHRHATERLGG